MARGYPYADSLQALLRPAEGLVATDFFQEWTANDVANDRLLCAEMSRLAYADEPVVSQALTQVGFELKGWLGGPTVKERFASWGADGFVASESNGRIAVAFRGTESDKPEDLLVDLLTRATPWPRGGNVHEGFAAALDHVRDALDRAVSRASAGRVLVTGHSLGAALATLVAADPAYRADRLITFGSPRVGDHQFVTLMPARADRFVNCCDLVTRVPPEVFDAPSIRNLFRDLFGQHATLDAAAGVIAPLLSIAGITSRFEHVGPVHYVNLNGRVVDGGDPGEAAIAADQKSARDEYRRTHPLPAPNTTAFLAAARDLAGVFTGRSVAEAVRDAGVHLVPDRLVGTVPLRDLADHAPINYVSAMARSV